MTTWTLADRAAKMNPSAIREILKLTDRPGIISMAGGLPSPLAFPLDAFTQACQTVMQRDGAAALQYATSEGFAPLRQAVADFLPWEVDPDQVLITTGSQQALDLIGKLFISPGDPVFVAAPTYLGALQAFNGYQPSYSDMPEGALATPSSLDLERTERRALGYFVPDFANPTGVSMTLAERETLLDLAKALEWTLVEDAAYRELRFVGEPAPTLLSLDIARSGGIDNARTLFLGTLSKTLSPALRIGWVCGPKAVIEKLVLLKQGADLHVSTINQMVAHRAVSEGYDQHLHRLRGAYGHKARVMLAALERAMPKGVTWSHPEGGMFVWIDLPEGIDGAALLARAIKEERVAFVPGAPFFAEVPRANAIRLSYSLPTDEQIEEGVARLARLIGRVMAEA